MLVQRCQANVVFNIAGRIDGRDAGDGAATTQASERLRVALDLINMLLIDIMSYINYINRNNNTHAWFRVVAIHSKCL
jgi:hypothetical protein